MWQELYGRLGPRGLEIVTVALDVDTAAARPFIEAAAPTHPSLVDNAHVLDERFGVVNVPNGVWIDERGVIVRPAEPAFPGHSPVMKSLAKVDPSTLPPDVAEMMTEARKIKTDPDAYLAMLLDWVERGAESPYALAPEEVVRRSGPRGAEEAAAAAHFALGEHLQRAGDHAGAVEHWGAAHRLHPDNWTYKRQAWNFEDPVRQGRTDAYDTCWLDEVKRVGAENYYPPLVP